MKRRKLAAEEQTERASLNVALARYHTEPGWALPAKGENGLWQVHPWTPAPRSPSGFAPPFREEAPEPTPEPRPAPQGMSMAEFMAGRRPVQEQPVPASAPKPAKATTAAQKKAQKEAAEKRQRAAQGSML